MKPTYGKKLSKKVKQDTVFAFCMCIGACILYCAFFVFPMLEAFRVSTYEWSGFNTANIKVVGMENFRRLLSDQVFLNALKNNVKLIVFGGILVAFLGMLFALVLADDSTKFGAFLRGMIFYRCHRYRVDVYL